MGNRHYAEKVVSAEWSEKPRSLPTTHNPLQNEEEGKSHYTFSSSSFITFLITAYVIQELIKSSKSVTVATENTAEFEYAYEKYTEVLTIGAVAFEYKGKLVLYRTDQRSYKNTIAAEEPIDDLILELKNNLKWKNPLRGQFVQLVETSEGHAPILKPKPKIAFKDVILDEKMKEDIYDNTIFQLEKLNENNGVILYGDPGVGKTLICSAITKEANEKGFTVCYITSQTAFSVLDEFIQEFISPCIIIFEDIDSFAESRLDIGHSEISDFLQFINGISEREDNIVFIATTNYLEKLDKAVSNRPVRFNRKFKFDFPTEGELKQLVALYFNEEISEKYYDLYSKEKGNFAGAHIREIKRTAKLLGKKRDTEPEKCFEDAFELVKNTFSTKLEEFGFNQ